MIKIEYYIKEKVIESNMTIREIAKKAQIPFTTVNSIIQGYSKNPSLENMVKISIAMEIKLEDLYKVIN